MSLRQGLGLRVEPPRLDPDDPDPELLGEGGAERTAGGGDDGRGEDVRAGAALLVLLLVPLEVEVDVDGDFLPSSLTEGDFPDVLLEPELPETDPRSR
jgi:hypothetical protein